MNSLPVSDITEGSIVEESILEDSIPNQEDNTYSKRGYKSEIWDYFNRVEWTKDRRAAECNVSNCKKVFSCGSGGTTKPLWRHLESAHRTRYILTDEYQKKRQKTQKEYGSIDEMFKKSAVTTTSTTIDVDNEKLRDMVAIWLINRQRPLITVEDPELVEIFQYLNPTAQPVKADAIKNTVMELYNLGKQELRTYLSRINSKISFTSDLWTSPNNKAFVSVTAHYIDDNWALQEVIVDFGLMSGRHDGVNIANGFFTVLDDYKITSKLLAITLDNATNNNVFVRELAAKLKSEANIKWNSEHLRFRCFNHILNLAAQAALGQIKDDVSQVFVTILFSFFYTLIKELKKKKIRALNAAIRTSPQRFELLEDACNACRIKFRKPILDCPTRWSSTYDMIRNGLSLKAALNTLTISHDDLHQYAIPHDNWATLEKIADFLEPFRDLTVKMSASFASTAFSVIPLFNIIIDHVEDAIPGVEATEADAEVSPLAAAATEAREKLVQYYSKTNTTTMLCTALDPRRKFHYFTKKGFQDDEINATKALMRELFETEYAAVTPPTTNHTNPNNTMRSATQSLLDADFDDEDEGDLDEIECYVSVKQANKDIDVLAWWRAHQTQFPRLARMARDYLAIPASSVASERAFSAAGNLLTNKRSNLAPKTVRATQCLRSWMQGPLRGKLGVYSYVS